MSVKRGNLRADTVVKNYWRSNEQFADFFNAVLFDGEQVIKPDELIPVITIVVYYGESHGMGLLLYMKCLIFQKQWNHLSMIIRCIW